MGTTLLVDYRQSFWGSAPTMMTKPTMDVGSVVDWLSKCGHEPTVRSFSDDLSRYDWQGEKVLYTSSEDPGLHYKSFIEDVLFTLEQRGARLVPSFPVLRAHHNKVQMELLRQVWLPDDPMIAKTTVLGVAEDLEQKLPGITFPVFVKRADGSGASNVRLARSEADLRQLVGKLSSTSRMEALRERRRTILHRGYVARSSNRQKVVVQSLIPNLPGDFKVLKYGDRFFATFRANRKNDLRASGSGPDLRHFDIENYVDPNALFAYATEVAAKIPSPFVSMDIACADGNFFLIEFQGVNFGDSPLAKASQHWVPKEGGGFKSVAGTVELERVFAEAASIELDRYQ